LRIKNVKCKMEDGRWKREMENGRGNREHGLFYQRSQRDLRETTENGRDAEQG
jgi:hypothetical protein